MQAWQEEVERAGQSQRDAETKISSLEVINNITKYSIFYSTYLFFIQVVPKNTSSISNMFFVVVIRFIVVEVLYCMELLSIL
jgi:hypothetical protein